VQLQQKALIFLIGDSGIVSPLRDIDGIRVLIFSKNGKFNMDKTIKQALFDIQ